ncbi:MAG: hypothetical protein JSU01_07330 [Bacteroidetes bacterium]|nr:hypothetical protein [Bacteroidota bacterium]
MKKHKNKTVTAGKSLPRPDGYRVSGKQSLHGTINTTGHSSEIATLSLAMTRGIKKKPHLGASL